MEGTWYPTCNRGVCFGVATFGEPACTASRGPVQLLITNLERCVRLLRGIATGTYTIKTRGSRLGSLYYGSTNLTIDLPAGLACEIDVGFVVEVTPLLFFRP